MLFNGRVGWVIFSFGEWRGCNFGLGICSFVGDVLLVVGLSGGDLFGGDDGVIVGFGVQEDGCGEMEIIGVVVLVDDGCMVFIKVKLVFFIFGCCCCCEVGCVVCVFGLWFF